MVNFIIAIHITCNVQSKFLFELIGSFTMKNWIDFKTYLYVGAGNDWPSHSNPTLEFLDSDLILMSLL